MKKYLALLFVLPLLLFSCEQSEPYGNLVVIAPVQAVFDDAADSARFSLTVDKTNKQLWVSNASDYLSKGVKDENKYLASYQEYQHEYRDGYNSVIQLIDLLNITIGVQKVNPDSLPTLPNHKVLEITDVYLTQQHLNISFTFLHSAAAIHSFFICQDTSVKGSDITLYFRHKCDGIQGTESYGGVIAVDLSTVVYPKNTETATLTVNAPLTSGTSHTTTVSYTLPTK
ncbi:MAG: hypothetical protein LBK47_08900 [Prevotellaceae bacterium]|jgi:hypothetical protein|nr:hypothetical protein [Prevotellaceae bacterium]